MLTVQLNVSIHTPAWGATAFYLPFLHFPTVSIHTPAWGATSKSRHSCIDCFSFNPHARVGRDLT